MMRRSLLTLLVLVLTVGCEGGLKRPYGYLRLGALSDLRGPETFIRSDRIFVRHDARGFSAMSTESTDDLAPLNLQGDKFVSEFSASTYAKDGTVLTPPATHPLPYFDLVIDASVRGGPKDTLYVRVGVERPADWRLPDPGAPEIPQP